MLTRPCGCVFWDFFFFFPPHQSLSLNGVGEGGRKWVSTVGTQSVCYEKSLVMKTLCKPRLLNPGRGRSKVGGRFISARDSEQKAEANPESLKSFVGSRGGTSRRGVKSFVFTCLCHAHTRQVKLEVLKAIFEKCQESTIATGCRWFHSEEDRHSKLFTFSLCYKIFYKVCLCIFWYFTETPPLSTQTGHVTLMWPLYVFVI